MKFYKNSIIAIIALAAGTCFGVDYAAKIDAALSKDKMADKVAATAELTTLAYEARKAGANEAEANDFGKAIVAAMDKNKADPAKVIYLYHLFQMDISKGNFGEIERHIKSLGFEGLWHETHQQAFLAMPRNLYPLAAMANEAGDPKAAKNNAELFGAAVSKAYEKCKNKEEKVFLLGVLQICSGKESLKTLEAAIADKDYNVAEAARMALEKNMSPDANRVLENAAKSTKDSLRIAGIVNSLAARKAGSEIVAKSKTMKDKNIVAATYIENRDWPETDFAKFQAAWAAGPTPELAKKAIAKGSDDRAFVLAAPAFFDKSMAASMPAFKTRYAASEVSTRAWVLSSLSGNKAAKNFIIEEGLKADSEDTYAIRMAAADALAPIGDKESAKAVFDMLKQTNSSNMPDHIKGSTRFWCETSLVVMRPADANEVLLTAAKANDGDAIKLLGKRGVYKALPMIMQNIKDNKERGACLEALMSLADDKVFLEYAKFAAESNDDFLVKGIVRLSTNVGKRVKDADAVIKGLDALSAKASEASKTALDRAKEMIEQRGEPKKEKK